MKVPKRLGAPIASRELARDGSGKPIHVFIWKPFKVREEEWACPYQIKGLGDEAIRYSYGSDAMQALQLSFDGVRVDLNPKLNRILFLGSEIAEAGFPRTIAYSFGADVYDYLCDIHDQELMPFPDDPRRSTKVRAERVAKWKTRNEVNATSKSRKRSRKDQS